MSVATADRLRQLTESIADKEGSKNSSKYGDPILELRAVKRRPKTLWQRQMQVLG